MCVSSQRQLGRLVETAKANGVEPHAYLAAVFERLSHAKTVEDFEGLLPWNFEPARRAEVQ
jgi:transposase